MIEERRIVTALFADVVGSTALAERLGAETAKLLVGDAITAAVASVEYYGGVVNNLTGDGVLAIFGAPTAHEDDPERALLAALGIVAAMHDYEEQVRRSWAIESFAVRVGVHTGEVVAGEVGAGGRREYGVVGDTINTAARIQQAAEPGQVLVTDMTRRLCAERFSWGDPVRFTLKGKEQAVVAHPLQGANPDHEQASSVPLLGREHELAVLRDLLEALRGGRGGVLFVVGEAGIGKSRLIAELRAAATGVQWLEGRSASYAESIPYWLYREVLRDWLGISAADPELRARVELRRRLESLFDRSAADLLPYLASLLGLGLEPDVRNRLAQLSPESLQYRTFEVMQELVSTLASTPVVIALDDLHWADATSIQLTDRLLELCESSGLLLVIGQRPEPDHPSWALRGRCEREYPHIFRELRLQPLGAQPQRALLELLVGPTPLSVDLQNRLLDYAEGNPFYLEEMVRALPESDGSATVRIPDTVEGAILARIDRLDPASRAVVAAASVLGRSFRQGLLEAVAEQPPQDLRRALHQLLRLDLVREDKRWPEPEYRFRHALIQEAVYATLVAARRRALHRRAAEWLEEQHRDHPEAASGILAHHWLQAEEPDKAIEYLRLAGDQARAEWALDESIRYYRTLVPLLHEAGRPSEVAETLFKLGLALHTALRYREAQQAWNEAFAAWPSVTRTRVSGSALLRVATHILPFNVDPAATNHWTNIQLCMQLYDRLVEGWPGRNIVPSLAERWEVSDDGLRYVFRLRPGLRWHDGSPLGASDAVAAILRNLDPQRPGASASIYFALEHARGYVRGEGLSATRVGVHALDDRAVEIRLERPAPYFMSVANRPDASPHRMPASQIGSGAFDLEELTEERVVLRRRDQRRAGNVERVEIARMTLDEATAAYQADEVDMMLFRMHAQTAALPADHADASLAALTTTVYTVFNCRGPAARDVQFRRALASGLNREALASAVQRPHVIATGGLVPPALQGHTPDISVPFEPERARALLSASGVADKLILGYASDHRLLAEHLMRGWHEVLGLDFETYQVTPTDRMRADADLIIVQWLPGYPDPEYYLRLLLHSESLSNDGAFQDPVFDDLVERACQERNAPTRLDLFHQADRLAVQDMCAVLPLVYAGSFGYVKPWVKGWWEWGKSCASFADLIVSPDSPRYRP